MPIVLDDMPKSELLLIGDSGESSSSLHEAFRAERSFGTREVSKEEIGQYGLQFQAKVLEAQNRANVATLRVAANDSLRTGVLPIRLGKSGGNARLSWFRFGRFLHSLLAQAGRLTTRTRREPLATERLVCTLRDGGRAGLLNQGFGNVDMQPRVDSRTIQSPDRVLARLLGYGPGEKLGAAFAVTEFRPADSQTQGEPLFAGRAPLLADIKQCDKRATGYFLSNLAAILARADGAVRIQNIMKDHGDGTVTVRFYEFDVRVSKDRLTDRNGYDVFSVGAPWVRIMEKAFLGYMAAVAVNRDKFEPSADFEGLQGIDLAEPDLFRRQERPFRFDSGSPQTAQRALAHTLAGNPAESVKLDYEDRIKIAYETQSWKRSSLPDDFYGLVKATLEEGGSAYATVGGFQQWFRLLRPGQTFAILSTGQCATSAGELEDGYWVFDPRGDAVSKALADDFPSDDGGAPMPEGARGLDACFFVSQAEATTWFAEFCLASAARSPDDAASAQKE